MLPGGQAFTPAKVRSRSCTSTLPQLREVWTFETARSRDSASSSRGVGAIHDQVKWSNRLVREPVAPVQTVTLLDANRRIDS